MSFLRNPYLVYPFVLLLALFAFDRIFLIPQIKNQLISWKKVEPPLYESKEGLFEQMVSRRFAYEWEDRQVALVMGSSRAGEFSSQVFNIFSRKKIAVYNYSAPLATPSFHAYYLKRVLETTSYRPAFVLLEADPLLFHPQSIRYSLSYSYDPEFVLENTDIFRDVPDNVWDYNGGFSVDESETFFLKRMFALYRYPLDPSVIKENNEEIMLLSEDQGIIKMTNSEFRDRVVDDIRIINSHALGGIPSLLQFQNPLLNIEKDAKETFEKMGLSSFRASPTQVHFFKQMVETLAEKEIPVLVYWPVAAEPLYRMMRDADLSDPEEPTSFRSRMLAFLQSVRKRYPQSEIQFLDYQNDNRLRCRNFADSHHLAGSCFVNLTRLIVEDAEALPVSTRPSL